MKTKTIGVALLTAVGLFTVGVRPAHAILVYGIVWEDVNGNGIRDTGDAGINSTLVVTVTRDAGGFSQQLTTSAKNFDAYGAGIFNVASGGYVLDFNWGSDVNPAYTGAYTVTISIVSGYSGFTSTRAGAPGGFVGAGISGGTSVNGKFGTVGLVPITYPDTSDTSGFDSDVSSLGTYSITMDNNYNAFRIDAGLVPIPEPANVALAVFGVLGVGGSVLRRMRAKKTQD